ncbi:MAG: dihydrodipicolinate synthase family protein [Betaproteobacteria bacterium]|nr:dihydrodipicolinate synthase family protein [Betaproteobacteria bacterium]
MGAKSDDGVYEFYRFIAERVDIGIVLFNIPTLYYPIGEHLTKRLATIPNSCGFKQGGPQPAGTILPREAVGKELVVSVADETPWLYNLSVMGDQSLLNYCPHLYQVPGYLPVRDYTQAALAGDMKRATDISRSLNALRAVHAKWITGYGKPTGRVPSAELKYCPVRSPCTEMTDEDKEQLRTELEATGLLKKVALNRTPARQAA